MVIAVEEDDEGPRVEVVVYEVSDEIFADPEWEDWMEDWIVRRAETGWSHYHKFLVEKRRLQR